jgi:hypothetical protein
MRKLVAGLAAVCAAAGANADPVTDWNAHAGEIIQGAGIGTPPANRVTAIAQTAVYEAVNCITQRYPVSGLTPRTAPGASVEAAVAGGEAESAGIALGEQAMDDATLPDLTWVPLVETPMHREYPCAHCIIAASVATVITTDVGEDPIPTLMTTSDVVKGAVRSWPTPEDLVREASMARIYDGVHYRNSSEIGAAMGRQVAGLAAQELLAPP